MLSTVPNSLEGFRNFHRDGTIVVCGCGRSLGHFSAHRHYITIGVNDVGRLFTPTYLVVLNPRNQFAADRFEYIASSQAQVLFTQLNLGVNHPHIVRFGLGQRNGVSYEEPNLLPYTTNSPYVAMCLAALMGAKQIGVIGVDFTDDHFYGPTGKHALSNQLSDINQQYRRLNEALQARGINVVNLSSESLLTSFRKGDLDDLRNSGSGLSLSTNSKAQSTVNPPLKIVSYSTSPVSGVPSILARCITAATPHQARCVWAHKNYGNGIAFEGDVEWTRAPVEAERLIGEADLVIVHNGKISKSHRNILMQRPVITMAHNYIWNVDTTLFDMGYPGLVVGQYQATLSEFAGWSIVPNPLPLWESDFRPEQKPEIVTIAYTPSGQHDSYPEGHRLYWHGKGYHATTAVLDTLARRFSIEVISVRHRQFSHAEALSAKRRAHIVIDECVTGSYHRNSLEGLACGCIVINGVQQGGAVAEVFSRCAPNSGKLPFVQATLDTLEHEISALIEAGSNALAMARSL